MLANSVEVQVHQKLGASWILVPGYRVQREAENPRAKGAPDIERGSDYLQLETKWRFAEGLSTDKLSYLSFLSYLYKTSAPSFGQGFGAAVQTYFDLPAFKWS